MNKDNKKILSLAVITFLPIIAIYLPFILKLKKVLFLEITTPGFANIIKNWDGPHYIIVAKSMYDFKTITKMLFVPLNPLYYTAHFPFFPLLIRILAPVFGWLHSGLLINLVFGFLLNILFFKIASFYSKKPLFLTFVFTVFPARFLITRAIIAPETLLLFLILLSLFLWKEKKYFLSSLFGFLAVLTKIQGLFLFAGYLGSILEKLVIQKKFNRSFLWSLLIPFAFILLSLFYYYRVGDFFAFFKAEEGNKLFIYFPFSQFNYQNPWSKTGWLEDVVFYLIGMVLLTIALHKNKKMPREWFYFSLFYSLFLIIIPQRDITRFSYPLIPFFALQFEKFLTSSIFKLTLFLSLPAIFFYTLNFILVNQAPISNWAPFLTP